METSAADIKMPQLFAEICNKAFHNHSLCPGKRTKGGNVPLRAQLLPRVLHGQPHCNGLPLTQHQTLVLQEPLSASNFSSVLGAQVGPGNLHVLKVRMPFYLICQPRELKQSIPAAKRLIRETSLRKTYYWIIKAVLSSCSDLTLKSNALRFAAHEHINIRRSGILHSRFCPLHFPSTHARPSHTDQNKELGTETSVTQRSLRPQLQPTLPRVLGFLSPLTTNVTTAIDKSSCSGGSSR